VLTDGVTLLLAALAAETGSVALRVGTAIVGALCSMDSLHSG